MTNEEVKDLIFLYFAWGRAFELLCDSVQKDAIELEDGVWIMTVTGKFHDGTNVAHVVCELTAAQLDQWDALLEDPDLDAAISLLEADVVPFFENEASVYTHVTQEAFCVIGHCLRGGTHPREAHTALILNEREIALSHADGTKTRVDVIFDAVLTEAIQRCVAEGEHADPRTLN